jgi:hypothetical protein
LAQGNYRAEIRIRTVRRLLAEIGMEPERAVLVRCAPEDDLDRLVRDEVKRFGVLGRSPILAHRHDVVEGQYPDCGPPKETGTAVSLLDVGG